jgi:hypothetical protein
VTAVSEIDFDKQYAPAFALWRILRPIILRDLAAIGASPEEREAILELAMHSLTDAFEAFPTGEERTTEALLVWASAELADRWHKA